MLERIRRNKFTLPAAFLYVFKKCVSRFSVGSNSVTNTLILVWNALNLQLAW